jgi:hypothetical protein
MARGSLFLSHNRDTLRLPTSTSSVDQSVNRHQQSSARFDGDQMDKPSVCHGKQGIQMTGSSFRVSSSSRGLPALHPSTTLDFSHG